MLLLLLCCCCCCRHCCRLGPWQSLAAPHLAPGAQKRETLGPVIEIKRPGPRNLATFPATLGTPLANCLPWNSYIVIFIYIHNLYIIYITRV